MSGQYRTEPSQLDSEWTAILSPDGDRLTAVRTTLDAAEVVVAELNRLHSLAARSGSPEGWPEGAEPATLGAVLEAPDDWELRFGPNWIGAKHAVNTLKVFNKSFVLVARRKPKPVTRDVRADEISGEVTVRWAGSDVRIRPQVARYADDGSTVASVSFIRSDDPGSAWRTLAADFVLVLVEEPNG